MASGPRAYGVAVERKLYRVARGTCYFPDCKRAIMFDIGDKPVCDVEIAHIRGAEENSARYDETMTDEERAAFPNLILLCSGHHKLVDRDPVTFGESVLEGWKADNEDSDLAGLAGSGLNEETLTAVLEEIAGRLGPRREVVVELSCGLLMPQGLTVVQGLAVFQEVLTLNPELAAYPRLFVITIRNTGNAPVEVEAADLYCALARPDGSSAGRLSLLGKNDFPARNPPLPHRLRDAGAASWLTRFESVVHMVDTVVARGLTVPSLHAEVRLATGEVTSSESVALVAGPTSS